MKTKAMATTLVRTVRTDYKTLLARVKQALAEGRQRAKVALEREEVRTWWAAARMVNEHLRIHGGRAAYGQRIVIRLAQDLEITERYLHDILNFQRVFPIQNSSSELTLTHYRVLARIENPKVRALLYRKAVREKLSVPGLAGEIRSRKLLALSDLKLDEAPLEAGAIHGLPLPTFRAVPLQDSTARVPPPLKPRRGKFFTYRIVKPRDLHEEPPFYSIDLGFGNRHDLKLTGIKNPKEGEVIEAVRIKKDARGDRYRFKRVKAQGRHARELLYTYQAFVTKVVDDDTLWADIDLGFRFVHNRKLRFRGIDAAEIGKGKEASDFVRQTLARVPFVVIKVSGRDKFGRPLIDLFYLEGTEDREKVLREGIFLNQQLLDLGLARRVL